MLSIEPIGCHEGCVQVGGDFILVSLSPFSGIYRVECDICATVVAESLDGSGVRDSMLVTAGQHYALMHQGVDS